MNDTTYLGRIIRVDTNIVEVEIDKAIGSNTPIINGKVYKIGQIGTFVKVIVGNNYVYGMVVSISNTPLNNENTEIYNKGYRYLTVSLVGEKIGDDNFEKGIGVYPTINDEVHIVTENDLKIMYADNNTGGFIEIGKHASFEKLSVNLDVHKLVLRHCAILGSTGSGKSNCTVNLIKSIVNDFCGARVVLIDPHGEYSSAFPNAKVLKIGDLNSPLYVPFWLMNFDELAYFLVGAKSVDEQRIEYKELRETIVKLKRENNELRSGTVDADLVTADSPIPFNVRKMWYDFNRLVNATFSSSSTQDESTEQLLEEGDPEKLIPAKFKPYSLGGSAPFKSKNQTMYSYEKKLLSRLKDSRYDFLFNPGEYKNNNSGKDLHDLLNSWIGNKERITILDLSNAPFEVLDISVGLITRFIYDSMFWGRNETYTGKNRPLLMVYDESHAYLNRKESSQYAREAVERIFKEGRKFGIGACVISQRPSEISETILAQVGTYFALRLTNSSDQGTIKSLAPDNMSSIINLLPSLRIGEAIIIGEAIKIPSRVRLPLQKPVPMSDDPRIVECWKKDFEFDENNYKTVAKRIRERNNF